MGIRTALTAVGAALSTVVLATGTATIVLPGLAGIGAGVAGGVVLGVAGIVGLSVGIVVGTVLGWFIASSGDGLPRRERRILSGYATFGLVVSAGYILSLFAPQSLQAFVVVEAILGAGLVVAAVAHGVPFAHETP